MNDPTPVPPPRQAKSRGCLFYLGVTLAALVLIVVVSIATASWWVHHELHAAPFSPVQLNSTEQQVLDRKIKAVQPAGDEPSPADAERPDWVKQDEGATNALTLTEKEINALLARNTGLAGKAYIVVDRDAISARCNLPIDPDVPFLGGTTLRGRLQFGVTQEGDHVAVRIRDVRVWGISVPNAWLGGLKGVDLWEELASGDADLEKNPRGIESVRAEPGRLTIRFAE